MPLENAQSIETDGRIATADGHLVGIKIMADNVGQHGILVQIGQAWNALVGLYGVLLTV